MRHLQKLHVKYRKQGLVVLGVNTADAKDIAIEMLEENNVDFPNIIDTRDRARAVMDKYETLGGMSAVPMTYVIDPQGKIVDAWYGYQVGKAKQVAEKLLKNKD
jgi:peroxiredoxin